MVSGASLPTGLSVEQIGSTVLPLWALSEIGYNAIVLGDLHMAQMLSDVPFVAYCGSPQVNDFGEEANKPGVWILDVDEEGADYEFVELETRRFVTIDVDLEDPHASLETAIHFSEPLQDAVVRIRYSATEETHRRIDHHAIQETLTNAGVHKLFGGVQWIPVRENRARVASMDESLEPLAALALWLDANDVAESERENMTRLLAGWLA